MSQRLLFTAAEWQALQFAVIDVFMMVSQIEGETGMDETEQGAFYDLLQKPDSVENPLLRELLVWIGAPANFKEIFSAYRGQYHFLPSYFERSFSRVRPIIDRKLSKNEAQDFKVALALHFGGVIANASGSGKAGLGRVSEVELKAMTAIAKWLGTDMSR